MMQARRRFLEGNHYDPMRQAVVGLCSQVSARRGTSLLDIGCGGRLLHQRNCGKSSRKERRYFWPTDISKIAIKYAAKRYPAVDFCCFESSPTLC